MYPGDPLYKLNPFYTVYNKKTNIWHGIFYNNLSDSSIDLGSECDALWGCFRAYKANTGPVHTTFVHRQRQKLTNI